MEFINLKKTRENQENNFHPVFAENSTSTSGPIKLRLATYPWGLWILGAFVIFGSTYLLYHVIEGDLGGLFLGRKQGYWWQYLVAFILYLLGFACFFKSRIEILKLNKEMEMLIISNRSIWQHLFKTGLNPMEKSLKDIQSIFIEEYGEFRGDLDTRYYKVGFEFRNGEIVSVLETRSYRGAQKKAQEIRYFLSDYVYDAMEENIPMRHSPPKPKRNGLELKIISNEPDQ